MISPSYTLVNVSIFSYSCKTRNQVKSLKSRSSLYHMIRCGGWTWIQTGYVHVSFVLLATVLALVRSPGSPLGLVSAPVSLSLAPTLHKLQLTESLPPRPDLAGPVTCDRHFTICHRRVTFTCWFSTLHILTR